MQYVFTEKTALVETNYDPAEILHQVHDRTFHEMYPAPVEFIVNITCFHDFKDRFISAEDLQLLSVWYNRGTKIHIMNSHSFTDKAGNKTSTAYHKHATIKHPRVQWAYRFVNSLPKAYILRGCTTTEKAYEFGKTLIKACTDASKVPFQSLEEGYKVIMRMCIQCKVNATSPNAKTYIEAKTELDTAHDIECFFGYVPEVITDLTDIELEFYARVFDIHMPAWFLRASNIKTEHGFAICPFTDSTEFVKAAQYEGGSVKHVYDDKTGAYLGKQTLVAKTKKEYDGNDHAPAIVPTTLQRDSAPQRLTNKVAERAQLAEQVVFYLSLPIEQQKEFMTASYGYCDDCGEYFEIREGCHCGAHVKFEDDNEYRNYMLTRHYKLSEVLYHVG